MHIKIILGKSSLKAQLLNTDCYWEHIASSVRTLRRIYQKVWSQINPEYYAQNKFKHHSRDSFQRFYPWGFSWLLTPLIKKNYLTWKLQVSKGAWIRSLLYMLSDLRDIVLKLLEVLKCFRTTLLSDLSKSTLVDTFDFKPVVCTFLNIQALYSHIASIHPNLVLLTWLCFYSKIFYTYLQKQNRNFHSGLVSHSVEEIKCTA